MRRVLFITRADATARLLVFSQWADVLELLAHALQVIVYLFHHIDIC